MVQVEGRGKVAPGLVHVRLEDWEIKCLALEAQKRNSYRRYDSRKDSWGGGLRKGTDIPGVGFVDRPVLPILAGFVGEFAVCKKINAIAGRKLVAVDFDEKDRGDGGHDVDVLGKKTQIKTRQRNYRLNLVRRVSEGKRLCAMSSDWFVFCQWLYGSRVDLLGWATVDTVQKSRFKQSKVGPFYNLAVPDHELKPMDRLFVEIKSMILERSQEWH